MRKKSIVLILMSLVAVFGLSGCLDLFSVPGVAVSPDGQTLYFMGAPGFDMNAADSGTSGDASLLMKLDRASGATEVVLGDETTFVSAFDVSPTTGDVAVVLTGSEGGVTRLVLYNQAAGPRDLTTALPAQSVGTSLEFSPNGEWLAVSMMIVPAELNFEQLNNETLTPEQLQAVDSVVYLVGVNDGSVTPVSDQAGEWANTVVWSPNSQYIAYNVWVDSNGDNAINTSGGLSSMMGGSTTTPDLSQIRIYDVAGGNFTKVESAAMAYAPVFLDDNRVAYIGVDASMMMMGGLPTIQIYSRDGGTSTQAYQAQGMIMGMAVSPDGTQVAWTETGTETSDDGTSPAWVYLADTNFSAPSQLADVSSPLGFVDVPVWLPDSTGLLVTSTNIFSSMMGGFMSMGAAFAEEGAEEIPAGQQVVLVDTATGAESVLYEGFMLNSNYFASILSMAADAEALEGMVPSDGQ